jgi:hypothetical protein
VTQEPYGYASGDPLNFTDPTGECPACIAILVVVTGSAAILGASDAHEFQVTNRIGPLRKRWEKENQDYLHSHPSPCTQASGASQAFLTRNSTVRMAERNYSLQGSPRRRYTGWQSNHSSRATGSGDDSRPYDGYP